MNSANGLPLHQFNKLDHCRAFLKNSVRLDGRNFEDNRIVRISMDTIKNEGVIGSSHVQLGETVVFCGINVLIGNPSITAPDSGDCVCDVSVGPTLLKKSDGNRGKTDEEYELQNFLTTAINSGSIVKLKDLCIQHSMYAFRLSLQFLCVNCKGNLRDALLLSMVAALRCAKLPQPVVSKLSIAVSPANSRAMSLTNDSVVCVSVILIDDVLLVDPTNEEEAVCRARVSCVVVFEKNDGVDATGAAPTLLSCTQNVFYQDTVGGLSSDLLLRAIQLCVRRACLLRTEVGW